MTRKNITLSPEVLAIGGLFRTFGADIHVERQMSQEDAAEYIAASSVDYTLDNGASALRVGSNADGVPYFALTGCSGRAFIVEGHPDNR
ncbi:MAG: hypothetical protein KDH17_09695 [Rhodocyclaceae bacterium]|nr:hypothetical protein [Rhodocyclaceae bacterium]MCP5234805.1 hypothetical protein [Zoogloeaceae bacterium]